MAWRGLRQFLHLSTCMSAAGNGRITTMTSSSWRLHVTRHCHVTRCTQQRLTIERRSLKMWDQKKILIQEVVVCMFYICRCTKRHTWHLTDITLRRNKTAQILRKYIWLSNFVYAPSIRIWDMKYSDTCILPPTFARWTFKLQYWVLTLHSLLLCFDY